MFPSYCPPAWSPFPHAWAPGWRVWSPPAEILQEAESPRCLQLWWWQDGAPPAVTERAPCTDSGVLTFRHLQLCSHISMSSSSCHGTGGVTAVCDICRDGRFQPWRGRRKTEVPSWGLRQFKEPTPRHCWCSKSVYLYPCLPLKLWTIEIESGNSWRAKCQPSYWESRGIKKYENEISNTYLRIRKLY